LYCSNGNLTVTVFALDVIRLRFIIVPEVLASGSDTVNDSAYESNNTILLVGDKPVADDTTSTDKISEGPVGPVGPIIPVYPVAPVAPVVPVYPV
jgi:hypothetical protein